VERVDSGTGTKPTAMRDAHIARSWPDSFFALSRGHGWEKSLQSKEEPSGSNTVPSHQNNTLSNAVTLCKSVEQDEPRSDEQIRVSSDHARVAWKIAESKRARLEGRKSVNEVDDFCTIRAREPYKIWVDKLGIIHLQS
jgi:hypothetical protein